MKPFICPSDIKSARAIQKALRKRVEIIPLKKSPKYIAGVDASFLSDSVIAVACLCEYPKIKFISYETEIKKTRFPYIPGFLAFREGPAVISAIKKLKPKPDVVLFDGQGIAHPEGLGIASHIGVLLDIPSIGCAKSRLIGTYSLPPKKKGRWSPLIHNGKTIGVVLRTRDNVRPLFVSAGHKIDLKGSIRMLLKCIAKYRIPEPLRYADILTKRLKKDVLAGKMKCGYNCL